MNKKFITESTAETKDLAEMIAQELLASYPRRKQALIIGLEGDLGGGKTTFVQGFARGLGIKEKILSPTFVILKRFKIKDLRFKDFYHIDCYRVEKPEEVLALGFKQIISGPKNIVLIEWAEKIKKLLPRQTIFLKFKFVNINKREILWLKKD